ncbi:MAG: Bax inhibitor-1/YccA family protein [Dongiaceae bacterium]
MAIGPDREYLSRVATTAQEAADIDVGLRKYMLGVYNYMMIALAITGLVAYAVASSDALIEMLVLSPFRWVPLLGSLGIAFFFGFRIQSMSAGTAQTLFWVYSVLNGLWLAAIFLAYTDASIARTFFVTAGTFAGMSIYGYTTKRDLSSLGSFLVMGLIGLILAMVVNMFLVSSALDFAISVIGVLIFTGLTAFDTQKIKSWYAESDGTAVAVKKTVYGALQLYLDFINLFLFMLRFLGNRE